MTSLRLRAIASNMLIGVAIYPLVLVGVWALIALGAIAASWQIAADTSPLVYGLVFALLTLSLIDLLGVASVVLALVAAANLIEYAQLLVPGRSASAVDFVAGIAGIAVAATLVWAARILVQRHTQDPARAVSASRNSAGERPA